MYENNVRRRLISYIKNIQLYNNKIYQSIEIKKKKFVFLSSFFIFFCDKFSIFIDTRRNFFTINYDFQIALRDLSINYCIKIIFVVVENQSHIIFLNYRYQIYINTRFFVSTKYKRRRLRHFRLMLIKRNFLFLTFFIYFSFVIFIFIFDEKLLHSI